MKISQELQEYADGLGAAEAEAVEAGLREKAEEFREAGSEIYVGEMPNS